MRKLGICCAISLLFCALPRCNAPSNEGENLLAEIRFLQPQSETPILGPKADSCAYFPGKQYDEIRACKIDAGYSYSPRNWIIQTSGKIPTEFKLQAEPLIPAHVADLNVAINLSAKHPYMTGLACHIPDYAFFYQLEGKAVAVITLSTQCGTVHFEPPSPHRMSLKGFTRLLTVLEELKL